MSNHGSVATTQIASEAGCISLLKLSAIPHQQNAAANTKEVISAAMPENDLRILMSSLLERTRSLEEAVDRKHADSAEHLALIEATVNQRHTDNTERLTRIESTQSYLGTEICTVKTRLEEKIQSAESNLEEKFDQMDKKLFG